MSIMQRNYTSVANVILTITSAIISKLHENPCDSMLTTLHCISYSYNLSLSKKYAVIKIIIFCL